MSTQDAGEGKSSPDYAVAVAEYHASRARYIRTVTSDAEKQLVETIGKRRESLREEIANLTTLAYHRHEIYQVALKAYASRAPSRVTAAGLQPPLPTDRRIAGIGKLYKTAVHAAEEFREVDSIIVKRKEKLAEIDAKLRVQVEQYGRDLIAQLETETGLAGAFRRDPLLSRAHARMVAAQARHAALRDAN